MEKVKSFKWLIALAVLICIILSIIVYYNHFKHKSYDYKGVFVINTKVGREVDGCIYKSC